MHNSADSKVDTIYVPCYLNGSDGIFNMQYYDLLIGFDAAVLHPTTSLGDTLPTKAWRSEYPQSLPTLQASGNGFCPHSEEASASAASRLPTGQTRTTNGSQRHCRETQISADRRCLFDKEIRKAAISSSKGTAWADFIRYYDTAYTMALENNKHNLA